MNKTSHTYKMRIEYDIDIRTILDILTHDHLLILNIISEYSDPPFNNHIGYIFEFVSDYTLDQLAALFLTNIEKNIHYCYRTVNFADQYDGDVIREY